ncbi:MAG TPA: DUF4159 domain-containing protein [Tepidisphaeraceae bacterium]
MLALMVCVLAAPGAAFGQRKVNIPPPDSKPPPAAKAPPRTQTSGEETDIMDGMGPTMRKTQERQPPPPTSLTVMYKVQYGEKLQYLYPDGRQETFDQWESFKNDGSQIMHFANERLADGNNYQYAVRPLAAGGFDPVDIPLLYMTGDYDFTLGEAEVKNLRKFILDGGTILFNAARGLDEFNIAVVREMRKVFPQKTFMKLPPDHPIYNGRYRIKDLTMLVNGVQMLKAPEIYSLDIGTRAAVILVPGGLGTAWSEGQYFPAGKHIVGESAVRLGVNLVSYVLGITEYGKFLAQEFPIYAGKTKPGDVVRFAEARYTGSWDDNPALQNSLLQGLKENTEIDVDYAPRVVDLADAKIGNYPLVFMTGHYDFELSPEEAQNLHNYLARGGMLVASAAAGLKPFDTAFRREMKRVLPDAQLVKLPPSHPLFAMGWNAIGRVAYTPPAQRDDPTLEYPAFYGLFVDDRLVVLYTPFDFQSALNHESNAYAKGLTPDDALRIAINIMTYSLSH